MSGVLVDSNVILDVATNDPLWYAWSAEQLSQIAEEVELIINPIIYAEVSIGFEEHEEVEEALPADTYRREALPWEAAFLAGKCFLKYRRLGGSRHAPLPDFYIGAHASVKDFRLLTRDARRYRTYFPEVVLICPEPSPDAQSEE
ncbi:MAG: type II toxin-antitoxin system VapC family toxin [bacterium]|nr:type II toxin-antitoxin system VapC family toxin [bacterium]